MGRALLWIAALVFLASYLLRAGQYISVETMQACSWGSAALAGLAVLWAFFRLFAGGVSRLFLALLILAGLLIGGVALFIAKSSLG